MMPEAKRMSGNLWVCCCRLVWDRPNAIANKTDEIFVKIVTTQIQMKEVLL
jgi:hypothetical protein